MSPAALKRALDPAYIGSPFAQPFQFFEGDVSTPMDLTGRAVVLFLDRQGLPDAHHEITGTVQADGRVLFSAADTSAWIKGDYSLEVRLDGASVVVGRIVVAKGAGATGSDMVGAAQPPTAPGVVIAGSGVVQIVSVAPSAAPDPSAIILAPDLSAALGGAETLADALLWLKAQAEAGGTPSPILRDLIGGVVISSVATGALSVAAADQVLLSGAISSASGATGSLTVGAASNIALVGSAVSTSSLTGAMTVVMQIALAGTAAGSSAAAGSLTVTVGSGVTYLPAAPAPQFAYSTERLWAEHQGPLVRGFRTSDSATLDFGPGADGAVDLSGYSAFSGGADLATDRASDQSYAVNGGVAGANDALAISLRPMFRRGNAMRGKQPISMGMTTAGEIGERRMVLPAFANTRRSITRMWAGAIIGGTYNSIGIWGLGTDAAPNNNLSLAYDTTNNRAPLYNVDNGYGWGHGGPPTGQIAIFTYVSGPTSRSLYINGQLARTEATPAIDIALVGGWLGRASWAAAAQSPSDLVADIGWSVPLTDAERIAFETALAARLNIPYAAYDKLIAFDGHSVIAGMNQSGYWQNLQRLICNDWVGPLPKTPNFAISGQAASAIYGRRAATATAASAGAYSKRALVAQIATNNIEALVAGSVVGGGAATYTTWALPYIQYMQTTGGFGANVTMLTEVPRAWTGTSTTIGEKETERLAYNQALKDGAAANGYTVIDWGGLPQMTTGVASGGNPNPPNPAYYGVSTGVHPNPAGYALCRDLLLPLLQAALA